MDDAQCTASRLTPEQIDELVKELGGDEVVLKVLRREFTVSVRAWREQEGIVYFSITSNGRTGEQWITYFESKGINLAQYEKDVLRSKDFKPTSGITTEIAVLKGSLFTDKNRVISKIRDAASERKLTRPNPEVAGLIREMFTDEEIEVMGLSSIYVMHEPIEDCYGNSLLLGASRSIGGRWLHACYGNPDSRRNHDDGFAFVVP